MNMPRTMNQPTKQEGVRPTGDYWPAGWGGLAATFVLQLALYLVVFNAGVFADFGIANDYSIFLYDNRHCCLGFPETSHLFWLGRPLGGFILGFQLTFLDDINSFAWARLASSILGALTASYVVHLLRRDSRGCGDIAVLFTVLVFMLPAGLIAILWITTFVPCTIAIALAAVAYDLIRGERSRGGARRRIRLVGGVAALVASFLIYTPSACFYLVFTAWRAYFAADENRATRLRRAISDFILIAVISVAYFVAVKLATPPMMKHLFGEGRRSRPAGAYRLEFTSDVGRIATAFYEYVRAASELWLVGWSSLLSPLLFVALLVLAAVVYRRRGAEVAQRVVPTTIAVLAAIGVVSVPFVLSVGGGFSARNLLVPSALILVLVFVALHAVSGIWLARLAGLAMVVVASLAAMPRIAATVENASRELAAVRTALAPADADTSEILVRLPPSGDQFVDTPLYREFGHLASNSSLNLGLIRGVLRERGLDPDRVRIDIAPWGAPDHVDVSGRALVVDLTVAGYRGAATGRAKHIPWTVSVAPQSGCCSPVFAFDGEPGSFWEADTGFPVALELGFPSACFPLRGYRILAPFTEFDRAPRSWRLLGTTAAGSVIMLDSRVDESPWRSNEARIYSLDQSTCVSTLRFEFTTGHDPRILRIAAIDLARQGEDER